MGKKRKRIIYPKNWRHRNDCNILDVEGWCTAEEPSWRESDYLQPIRGRNLSDGQTHKRSQITSNDTRDNRTDEARLIEGRVTFNALPKWKAHVSWIFLSINATPSLLRSCATSVYNGYLWQKSVNREKVCYRRNTFNMKNRRGFSVMDIDFFFLYI